MKARSRGLLAAALLFAGCHAQAPRPPHLVLVVLDALRASNLGCYGYGRPTSPAIDRLAREGTVFETAIAVGGGTPQSMAGVFTGRYAFFDFGEAYTEAPFGMERFRRTPGRIGLPHSMTTLAERLAAAGYRTSGVITNPYVGRAFSMGQGFRDYEQVFQEGEPFVPAETVWEALRRHLESVDVRQPTFLYLHLMDTHGPYRLPDPRVVGPLPRALSRTQHQEAWKAWLELKDADPAAHRPDRDYMLAAYDSGIRRADETVGRLADFYRDRGLLDETVFAVTADHGEEFLEHGGTTHKGTLFEELVHVPLVLRLPPGSARGRRIPELVRNFDITPTLLDYAGVPAPAAGMNARSLRPLLEGRATPGPEKAYAGFPWVRMVRSERYKLLRRQDGSEAFYDLRADRAETTNRAGSSDPALRREQQALAETLDRTVERLRREHPMVEAAAEPATIDAETREHLKALGYVE